MKPRTVTASLLSMVVLPAAGALADPLMEALESSQLHADFRLRYENVDDSINDRGEALTLRSRLGFTSGELSGFSVLGEFVDVRIVGGMADYAPNRPGYAVIADPEVTAVNRASLHYRGVEGVDLGVGRQRIIHDNARFVGNVGWRQNEQTYDAFTAVLNPLPGLRASYAYLDQIHGITPAFDAEVDSHLLNVGYSAWAAGTVTGYGYFLENRDSGASNDTVGLRFSGSQALDVLTLLYTAEYAYQETDDFDADYWMAEGGLAMAGVTLKLAHEVLGSDGGDYGFQTPLATKHAFNGWADQFLNTPDTGLRDTLVTVSGKVAGIGLTARYHWFDADSGSADYGRELNLQAAKRFGPHYALGAKYARYDARDFSSDTDKFWLWGELQF